MSLADQPDAELLAAVRPRGWRAGLRRLGCPVVLVGVGYGSWRLGALIGAATWPWLGWVATPLIFLPLGVIASAVIAVIASTGDSAARAEIQRRTGHRSFADARDELEADLTELAPDQRGWVLLLQGTRPDNHRFEVRLDLRTDTEPPQGEARGVRGPRLDLWVNPPDTLEAWDQLTRPLRADRVTEMVTWLDDAALGSLPSGRPTGSGLRLEGAITRLGEARNTWFFGGTLPGGDDGSVLAGLTWRALDALDWDPTAS